MLKASVFRGILCFAPLFEFVFLRDPYLSENLFAFLLDPRGGGLRFFETNILMALSGCEQHHEGGAIIWYWRREILLVFASGNYYWY